MGRVHSRILKHRTKIVLYIVQSSYNKKALLKKESVYLHRNFNNKIYETFYSYIYRFDYVNFYVLC